jgi:hypothetical protein
LTEARLHITGYPDSDPEEQAELSYRLQAELRELVVVEDVSAPRTHAPVGAKGDGLEWAQLVVTFAGTLPPLIAAVRGWLSRHAGATLTIELDGDRLVLREPTTREQRDLIDAWLERHGG